MVFLIELTLGNRHSKVEGVKFMVNMDRVTHIQPSIHTRPVAVTPEGDNETPRVDGSLVFLGASDAVLVRETTAEIDYLIRTRERRVTNNG